MELFVPKELEEEETRTALVPGDVKKLVALGLKVGVESGLGAKSGYLDKEYADAGAGIVEERNPSLSSADIILRVLPSPEGEIDGLKKGALHISFLDPFNNRPLLDRMTTAGLSVVSMEMMPRTTLAQKMDALSSQANLAGYFAVIKAAEKLNKIIPMMMTPAGTISPARFFIIGVGVAGLQAIATAKRLGARVDAFDTRPVVEEQVKSLGARFLKIDLGETGETKQGYARQLSPEQIEKQRKAMSKTCSQSDVVITTAKLFGRQSPLIVTADMVREMHAGSILVDLAVESGGNVEGAVLNEEVVTGEGVRIIGIGALEREVPFHASQVYSSNLTSFIEHFWDPGANRLALEPAHEILKGCLLSHEGKVIHERFLTPS